MVGSYEGTVDFDPGAGTTNLQVFGKEDIFIAKYGPTGQLIWAKGIGGTGNDNAINLAIDSSRVYVVGYFSNTVDFNPGIGSANRTSNGNGDGFMLQLDLDGNFVRVATVGGTSSDSINDIAVDASKNMYVTGNFQGTVDFQPTAASST